MVFSSLISFYQLIFFSYFPLGFSFALTLICTRDPTGGANTFSHFIYPFFARKSSCFDPEAVFELPGFTKTGS